MQDLAVIEKYYNNFSSHLAELIPEGIYPITLSLLHHFDLLHFKPVGERKDRLLLPYYFHVIENPDKITLINDEFVIWVVPSTNGSEKPTYAMIALQDKNKELRLEIAVIASGVYNNSKLLLNIIEKFLIEIQENEKTLSSFSTNL